MSRVVRCKLTSNRKLLIHISLRIAECQKILLNYEVANNILSTLYNRELQYIKDEEELVFVIMYEYAELKFLNFDYESAYAVLASWEDVAVGKNLKGQSANSSYAKLLLLKAKVLSAVGDFSASEIELNKFKQAFDVKNNLHYQVEELNLQLRRCNYKDAELKLGAIMHEVNTLGGDQGLAYIKQRACILYLMLYYDKRNFEKFEEHLSLTADLFKNFDQFRLLRNAEFLSFIHYKILYFVYKHKYSHALNRINNILGNISYATDKASFFNFSLLKSEILIKSLRLDEGMDVLKEVLRLFDVKAFTENEFKNYDIFKRVHINMTVCYYQTFKYTNALKCMKFVLIKYYEDPKLFKNKDFVDKDFCKIQLLMAKVHGKLNDLKRLERYLEKCNKSLMVVHEDQYHPAFFKMYMEYFKYHMGFGDFNSCKGYLDKAELIIKRQYGKHQGLYINTSILYKHMGNYHQVTKQYQKCLECYKSGIKILEEVLNDENDIRMTSMVNEMACVCIIFNKLDLAQGYLKKCEKINGKIAYGGLELAKTYYYQGHYYKKISNFEQAIKSYNKAKEQYSEIYQNELRLDIIKCYYGIASAYHSKKKNSDALNLLEDCQNNLRTMHRSGELELTAQVNSKISQVRKALAN